MQSIFSKEGDIGSPQTPRGYYLDEVISALQKEIRRGKEYDAAYWAVELESFNEEKAVGAKILWNRLRVIASEDVSIAEPHAPLIIAALKEAYCDAVKRKDTAYRLFFVHAVLFLARSRKCRIIDDIDVVVKGNIKFTNELLPMPDYAIDMHTHRGRMNGRVGTNGVKHFLEEGAKLKNEVFKNPYKKSSGECLIKHGTKWLSFPKNKKPWDIKNNQ
jgi:replication-associated recombination protein RarA